MFTYFLFAIGFIFLIKGAGYLVDGSTTIAKRFGVSDLIIGLTIISFGTSAPEMLVNVMASLRGAGDIVIGNIIGSNIANIFLILGVSALIYPLNVKTTTTWKEIPLNILAAVVVLLMMNDMFLDGAQSIISRSDGLILIMFFIIFIAYTVGLAKNGAEKIENQKLSYMRAVVMIVGGMLGLFYGGKWVVEGAVKIASTFGLSEAMIGATIVALGTSLPELATSAMAAYKRRTDIAIGNVVGSNLFNIFWVLGLSAIMNPVSFSPKLNTDVIILLVATILLFFFAINGGRHHIEKKEGVIFLICYVAYIVFLVLRG